MNNEEVANLVARMDADYRSLIKSLDKSVKYFHEASVKIEKRNDALFGHLTRGAARFTGFDHLKGALAGLTVVGIGAGLWEMVKSGLEAASAIGDIAEQSGFAVERVQTLRYAVSQTGGTFADADTALITFNKNLGEFLDTGAGKAAQAIKRMGLDKALNVGQVRTTEQAFDFAIGKIREYGTQAQRSAALAKLFGTESGTKLAGLVNAGAQGLSDLEAKARSLGIVLSTETVHGAKEAKDKLDTLFQVLKAEGIAAVASQAKEIENLAKQITAGLPDLLLWVERWADWFGLIKLSPVQKLRADIADLQKSLVPKGPLDLLAHGSVDARIAKLKKLQGELLGLENVDMAPLGPDGKPRTAYDVAGWWKNESKGPPKLHVNDVAGQQQAAELAQRRADVMAQFGVDAATANAALIAAQNQLNVTLLEGLRGYHEAVVKQIEDEAKAKKDVIDADEAKKVQSLEKLKLSGALQKQYTDQIKSTANAKRAAVDAEKEEKLYQAGNDALVKQALLDGDKQIQQYKDEAVVLGLTTAAIAEQTYIQEQENAAKEKGLTLTADEIAAIRAKAREIGAQAQSFEDTKKVSERAVQVSDDVRQGLEDIGVAGLHGFKSMRDAAGQFIEQLAEMIVRLYVMKPLIEGMLGPGGTSFGGGFFGDIFGGLFGGLFGGSSGFAGFGKSGFRFGGIMTPQGPVPLRQYRGGGIARGRQFAEYAEGGMAEAYVPLPDGRRLPVALSLASKVPDLSMVAAASRASQVSIHVDARGAQLGVAEQIEAKLRVVAPLIVGAAVKQSRDEFVGNMARANRDHF